MGYTIAETTGVSFFNMTLKQRAVKYAVSKVAYACGHTIYVEPEVAQARVVNAWLDGYKACLKNAQTKRMKKIQSQKRRKEK